MKRINIFLVLSFVMIMCANAQDSTNLFIETFGVSASYSGTPEAYPSYSAGLTYTGSTVITTRDDLGSALPGGSSSQKYEQALSVQG